MYLLKKFCCICLQNKSDLKNIIDTDGDGVSFFTKLTSSIPEMCFEEMNDQRLICGECCVTLDTVYNFRQKCLKNKPNFISYIAQLQTYGNVSGSISVRLEDIKQEINYVKEEIDEENSAEYNFNDDNVEKSINQNENEQNEDFSSVTIKKECESEDEFSGTHFLDSENAKNNTINESTESCGNSKSVEFVTLKYGGAQVKKEDLPQDGSSSQAHMNVGKELIGHQVGEKNDIKFAEKSFECEICQRRFKHKGNFMTHTLIHSGVRPYECEICKKRFNHRGNLSTHMVIHSGERPHECEVCKKRFNRKSHLTSHMIIHSSERPHICEVCNNKYVHENDLKKHMKMHSADRKYECETCMKKFNSMDHLTSHIRVHTGERPYKCKVCDKRYMRKDNLTQHMRLHTGVRPFKCDVCKKGFNQRGTLNTHLLIHTGEKPYECEICKKRFNNKSNLTTHMVVHLGVLPFVPKE